MPKRLDSADMDAGPATLKVLPGEYKAFMIRCHGTNDVTDDALVAKTTPGLITGFFRDRPFMSLSYADLWETNEMDFGEMEFASVTNDAFTMAVMVPSSRAGDGNVFSVTDDDNMYFSVDMSGVDASDLATGTIVLYGIPAEGVMQYIPQMFTQTPNIAVSSQHEIRLTNDNITQIYFTTPANLARVQIEKDREVYCQSSWDALISFSNMDCNLENAYTAGARMHMHRSGAQGEALSDEIILRLEAGAGGASVPHIVHVSLDYLPDKLSTSATIAAAKVGSKLRRKAQMGKSRPVSVAKALTGADG